MLPNQIIANAESEMHSAIERFKEEIKKIHTGRANPSLIEDLLIDYYGSKAPIKQIASINIPEPRMIIISPWNKDDLVHIEKAINESDLKITPQNDGEAVRLVLPSLTQERREEMARLVGKEKEEARVQIRQTREDSWDKIQEMNKSGSLSEDDKFRYKEQLQKLVDKINAAIDEIAEKKEQEITNI